LQDLHLPKHVPETCGQLPDPNSAKVT
jgi:hypothetical protein